MKRKSRFRKEFLLPLAALPFLLGTIGYWTLGDSLMDSLYFTLLLHVMNPATDEKNLLVELSRWTAPLVTASGILLMLQNVYQRVRSFFLRVFCRDTTVVYSDNEQGELLARSMKHGIVSKERVYRKPKDQILLFEKDMDNLHFYERNRELLSQRRVYMNLNEMDSFLMRESTVRYFNLTEITARQYWKTYNLLPYFEQGKREISIAIIGFGRMGQWLLKYGLLNNLYQEDQKIAYHIWGDCHTFARMHEKMDLMNGDSILYHEEEPVEDLALLKEMDRIILAGEGDFQELEMYLYLCQDREVYFYSPRGDRAEELYAYPRLITFGGMEEFLTEELVKTDRLYRAAKQLNFKYEVKYDEEESEDSVKKALRRGEDPEKLMEDCWEKLNGFTKGSNISAADCHEIRLLFLARLQEKNHEILQSAALKKMLADMEHIRWCRYHFLNYWVYGPVKQKELKIHSCLLPREELSRKDQDKDDETIQYLLEVMPLEAQK